MPDTTGIKTIDLTRQAQEIADAQKPRFGQRLRNALDALAGRPFGPGTPLQPAIGSLQSVHEQSEQKDPRQFVYPTGVNMQTTPRREYPDLTPFEQLRNLAQLYDVAAMCVAARIEEFQGIGWSVAAKNKKMQNALQPECEAATRFFEQPDKLNDFYSWLGMLLYELFTTDAMTIYKRLDLAGRLYSLDPVDGATIKPLVDERGRTVAYQQIVHGFPETQFRRPSADSPDEKLPIYTPRELLYRPRWQRTFSPYGSPPTEWVILRVNQALRKQTGDLAHFTDGNVPAGFAVPPDAATLSPEQVRQFERDFNATLEGNSRERAKLRFLPWNMSVQEFRPFTFETALDDWMMRITCAAYAVPPQELGFTNDVNRATAELQEAVNERRGLKPLANWLKTSVFDPLIQNDLAEKWPVTRTISLPGQPTRTPINPWKQVEMQWHFGDKSDDLTEAQTHAIDIGQGVISPDESRTMRYGDVLEGKAPGPPAPAGLDFFSAPPRPVAAQPAELPQAVKIDLSLWRKKAEKAVKSGKPALVPFESANIPTEWRHELNGALRKAETVQDVRAAFESTQAVHPFCHPESFYPDYG